MRLFKALVMPLLLGGLVFNFSIVNAEEGVASWYGHPYHGRTAANGTTYNMYEMTAAHKKLPFGTKVKVINKRNNKSVIVEITEQVWDACFANCSNFYHQGQFLKKEEWIKKGLDFDEIMFILVKNDGEAFGCRELDFMNCYNEFKFDWAGVMQKTLNR